MMGLDDLREVIHRCFRCGYCKLTKDYNWLGFNCPSYNAKKFESYSPGGMLWLSYAAFVTGEIEPTPHMAEILYSCSMCGNCSQSCRFRFGDLVSEMLRRTREEIIEKKPQLIPSIVQKFFKNVYRYGNPYGETPDTTSLTKLGIEEYKNQEYLLYFSPVSLLDPVAYRSAISLAKLLKRLNISFGILGAEEICEGNEVLMMGEKELFNFEKGKLQKIFERKNVKKVIALSPHSYNALKNYYRGIEVEHYTQLLDKIIKDVSFYKNLGMRVTYHDPCFLGRYNSIYEEPRNILKSIPGIELVEMPRNRENAFCCGGGAGNFYTGLIMGGEDSPERVRVREALRTGADIIAVACPICQIMLTLGVREEGVEEKIQVIDIPEIILNVL